MSTAGASTPSTLSMAHVKHHPELWFDDGSIILVAQDMGFRVYRGLLALQSTVFADMLVASTSSADETLDGCPVIPLADAPHDLAHLLRVLLPTSPIQPPQPSSFEAFEAIIRLADKYHIQSAQDQALRALQQYHFTSDFATFSGPPDTTIVVEPIHAISAVNLARLTNSPRMLPLALYKCCCLDDETLRAGWKRADGSVERLAPADLKRCAIARASLIALYVELHTQLSRKSSLGPECNTVWECGFSFGLVSDQVHGILLASRVGCDVFPDWATMWGELMSVRQPCPACVMQLAKMIWEVRRHLWDALPEIFGVVIEGWKSSEAWQKKVARAI